MLYVGAQSWLTDAPESLGYELDNDADNMHRLSITVDDQPGRQAVTDIATPRALSLAVSHALPISLGIPQAGEAARSRAVSSPAAVALRPEVNTEGAADDAYERPKRSSSAPLPIKGLKEGDIRMGGREALHDEATLPQRMIKKTRNYTRSPRRIAAQCVDRSDSPPNANAGSSLGANGRAQEDQEYSTSSPLIYDLAGGSKGEQDGDNRVNSVSHDVGQPPRKRRKADRSAARIASCRREGLPKDRSNPDPVPESVPESRPKSNSSSSSDGGMRDEQEYCPSSPGGYERETAGKGPVQDDASDHAPCNRRQVRQPAARARPRCRAYATSLPALAGPRTSTYGKPSPPSSYSSCDNSDADAMAKFQEWPLQNVTLKRIVVNGQATFQLQFGWDPHIDDHPAAGRIRGSGPQFSTTKTKRSHRAPRSPTTCLAFTPEEDDLLTNLKEGQDGFNWPEIHRRFSNAFPGRRSKGSLQVHYSTKLKGRKDAASLVVHAPQDQSAAGPRRSPRTLQSREYEGDLGHSGSDQSNDDIEDGDCFPVDCILSRSGSGLFFLRWSDDTTSWEPRSHIQDMKMLSEFEKGYRGFDEGVDVLETRTTSDGLREYQLHWHGRPSEEDEWVPEEQMSPSRVESERVGGPRRA